MTYRLVKYPWDTSTTFPFVLVVCEDDISIATLSIVSANDPWAINLHRSNIVQEVYNTSEMISNELNWDYPNNPNGNLGDFCL